MGNQLDTQDPDLCAHLPCSCGVLLFCRFAQAVPELHCAGIGVFALYLDIVFLQEDVAEAA